MEDYLNGDEAEIWEQTYTIIVQRLIILGIMIMLEFTAISH